MKLFIFVHFQILDSLCFSGQVTNTFILIQLWAGQFNSFVIFPGTKCPHTQQETSTPPTPLYQWYFMLDNAGLKIGT